MDQLECTDPARSLGLRLGLQPGTTVARVAAQYAYMISSDFESPEARYALGPYTPVDQDSLVNQSRIRFTRLQPSLHE